MVALLLLASLLPPVYLKHLALLVCSMHILLGDRINLESLPVAECMLNKFYHQIEESMVRQLFTMSTQLIPTYTHK